MSTASSTDDGFPVRCDVCGESSLVNVSLPPGDSVCPNCGSFLWVNVVVEVTRQHQFVPDLRLQRLNATDRDGTVREMVDALATAFAWPADVAEELNSAILRREQWGSTGIGRGFALPHASHDSLEKCVTAMGYSPQGIDFSSLDGKPVHTIILVASPTSDRGAHLRTLGGISRSLRLLNQSAGPWPI